MVWLDRLGFHEAWIGEHHSAGFEIISSPEVWTHVLMGGEGQALQPDPRLERLPMESVGRLELAAFKAARVSFFSLLLKVTTLTGRSWNTSCHKSPP